MSEATAPTPFALPVECRWCGRPGVAVWVGATCVVRHDRPGGTCGTKAQGLRRSAAVTTVRP